MDKPKRVVIKLERWICLKGHKHTKLKFAAACDKVTKAPPATDNYSQQMLRNGRITTGKARNIFWKKGLTCSTQDISLLVANKILPAERLTSNSQIFVRAHDVRRLVAKGKHAWQLLNKRKPREPKEPEDTINTKLLPISQAAARQDPDFK